MSLELSSLHLFKTAPVPVDYYADTLPILTPHLGQSIVRQGTPVGWGTLVLQSGQIHSPTYSVSTWEGVCVVGLCLPVVGQSGVVSHPVRTRTPIPKDAAPPITKPAFRRKFLLETFSFPFLSFPDIADLPCLVFNLRLLFPFCIVDSYLIFGSYLVGTCDCISISRSPFPRSGTGSPGQTVPS